MSQPRESELRVNEEDKRALRRAAAALEMEDRPFGAVIQEMSKHIRSEKKVSVELTADDDFLDALKA